jgi:hypothetical protein
MDGSKGPAGRLHVGVAQDNRATQHCEVSREPSAKQRYAGKKLPGHLYLYRRQ